ncbi:MAG: Holliday junction branch migration protein RuvA [Pseudomonadota bacterium]
MIGRLTGAVDSVGEDFVILDVHGVGYVVHCPVRVLQGLPAKGEVVSLSIETYVREDQIRLFGFSADLDKEWFRMLMTVQGVGAKVALAVLSILSASDLANAIALQDKAQIARAQGVGKRVAERIVGELKNKAPALSSVDAGAAGLQEAISEKVAPRPVADAVSALVNLGYGQPQAAAAVAAAARDAGETPTTETLIRLGLKELAQ